MTTKAYLIGGRSGSTYYNDFWETTDGENWIKKGNLPFTNNYGRPHAVCYNNGELFVIPTNTSDVWVYNGTTWTKRATGQFSARAYSALIYYKGKLWFFGDTTTPSIYTSSDNGYTWVADNSFTISASAAVQGVAAIVINDTLVVGFTGTTFYQTTNGTSWTSKTVSSYTGTSNFVPLDATNFLGEAWGSSSTINNSIRQFNINSFSTVTLWATVDEGSKRVTAPQLLRFGNYVYHIGGLVYGSTSNNNWKKYDGTTKALINTGTAQFEARDSFAIVQFEDISAPSDLTGGGNISVQSNVNLSASLFEVLLNASANMASISGIKTQGDLFTIVTDLTARVSVQSSSILKTNATLFDTKINRFVQPISASSRVYAKGEVIDPSTQRIRVSNIVKNNGVLIQNAKILAVRDSDLQVFSAITDSSGAWSLDLELGMYHITCVYKDGSQNILGLVKPYVVIQ